MTASRQTRIDATWPIDEKSSKSMASVTEGSSSPTYKEAECGLLVEAPVVVGVCAAISFVDGGEGGLDASATVLEPFVSTAEAMGAGDVDALGILSDLKFAAIEQISVTSLL